MTDRLTPEQIAEQINVMQPDCPGSGMLADLLDLGYVIRHRDDVPRYTNADADHHSRNGWNQCWDYIFGDERHAKILSNTEFNFTTQEWEPR